MKYIGMIGQEPRYESTCLLDPNMAVRAAPRREPARVIGRHPEPIMQVSGHQKLLAGRKDTRGPTRPRWVAV